MTFYVSDAYTLAFQSPKYTYWPGPFNSSRIWGPSQPVTVSFLGGEFGFVVYHDSLDGANVDVQLALYDVTAPNWTLADPGPLPFIVPNGSAPNGMLMNAVCRYGQYARAGRSLTVPIAVGTTTPDTPDRQYQVGARITVHSGVAGLMAYQYFMYGDLNDG